MHRHGLTPSAAIATWVAVVSMIIIGARAF
jgi:hypothetical protein